MANVLDYLKWRGDLQFWQAPFCEVDALLLTELAYIEYGGIVPADPAEGTVTVASAARRFFARHRHEKISLGEMVPVEIIQLLRDAAVSPRYADVGLLAYTSIIDESRVEQFSAVSFHLTDGTVFISFRGTDDTIVGWKENFEMSFRTPVAAQKRAEEYIGRIGAYFHGNVRCGGHSKGGNLAIWAALHAPAEMRGRLTAIYNLDGPGFLEDVHKTDSYLFLKDRIFTIVPECSVVGMFLNHDERYAAVKSTNKGLWQHDGMSWVVEGPGFVRADDLNADFKKVNSMLSDWIGSMDDSRREAFTEAFFGILYSTKATTLTELAADRPALWRAFSGADSETKKALSVGFKLLLGESRKSVGEWLGR